ncbi:MAG: hypothetical protein JJU29_13870 [Verrucomicrobia bacterium]|nr:hypothetical protein [Verrucomicrobiota bacterium]MCH8513762.1 hypothetical protein [Kiritimatiellia bacterium]
MKNEITNGRLLFSRALFSALLLGLGTLATAQQSGRRPARPAEQARFEARMLLETGELLEVSIRPRAAGTSTIQMERKDREGIFGQPVAQIQRIHFTLSDMDADAITQNYYSGNYEDVLQAMRGRINPYFAFADLNANTNELVEIFIRALYHAGHHTVVRAAATELARHTAGQGDVSKTAEVYATLSTIKLGELEGIEDRLAALPEPSLLDPHAPAIWYAQAQIALAENDWETAYVPLARIVTEAPMETEWVGEALYLTAQYHHSRTNLVVANQICQEIMIVAPDSTWATKAEARMINLKEDAEALEITLTEFGEFREAERQVDDAAIDYRARQRALREEAARQRQEELDLN